MNHQEIIEKLKETVKSSLQKETSHDWWHVLRVYNNALSIAEKEEGADIFLVEIAALMHDIADHKFGHTDNDRSVIITDILENLNIDTSIIEKVIYITNNLSFKGGKNTHKMQTIEGQIVQDADRLDAIGAIGIARTFAYGSFVNRPFYLPDNENPNEIDTISHFYEKLLLLKDRMNTKTGKEKAIKRHETMEFYLKNFYEEWNGQI